MTSVVGVQQKFPTSQEIILQYRRLRDQIHHGCSTILKKYLKEKNNNSWQKYYINQTVHEIMFYILIICYEQLFKYRKMIFYVKQ